MTSVGVSAPGIAGTFASCATAMVAASKPGLTMNSAPASRQARAPATSSTVPAPISARAPRRLRSMRITEGASGTVIVTSNTAMPPAKIASQACNASSGEGARITGTRPAASMRRQTSVRVMGFDYLSILALAPCIARRTSGRLTIVVSPGVDMARAPCATPQAKAQSADLPLSRP